MQKKANTPCQARDKIPFLSRFVNDWATEELVKQYLKNRRGDYYRNGRLEVPDKYQYLKANAQQRDPNASRKRKAVADASSAAKKQKKNNSRAKRLKRVVEDEEDEDSEERSGRDDGIDSDSEESTS